MVALTPAPEALEAPETIAPEALAAQPFKYSHALVSRVDEYTETPALTLEINYISITPGQF